eukprot:TRINITY_DN58428_c0_g1_i1.p1 TRINITY_DN58428_c0_g1~~TRINITY_DN58428_c0_g1_i1.p1  ORF type:complete len:372 (+),score=49.77 TRINITY_DN58428_c0_g1_i1:36-1151(+)
MFIIEQKLTAYVCLFFGLFCWGTWGLLAKKAALQSEVFNSYFITAQMLTAVLCCLTLGMQTSEASPETMWEHFFESIANPLCPLEALLGGVLVATSNTCLSVAIRLAGVAVGQTSVLGAGLIGGTVLNFIIDPCARPDFLFGGVACCIVAMLFNAKAAHTAEKGDDDDDDAASTTSILRYSVSLLEPPSGVAGGSARNVFTPGMSFTGGDWQTEGGDEQSSSCELLRLCALGGLCGSLWSPLSTFAAKDGGLSPYGVILFFNAGQMCLIPVLLLRARRMGLTLVWGTAWQRFLGMCAGVMNTGGVMIMFIVGDRVSSAVSFGLLQCAPLVAAFWGLWLGELRGASLPQVCCFCGMIITYVMAILGILQSQK